MPRSTFKQRWQSFCDLPGIVRAGIILAVAIVLILLMPSTARADMVLKNPETGAELRLMDTPCTHGETLGHLKEEWRPKFKNARILNGKGFIEFYGCWIQHDAETAVVMLQDGALLDFRLAAFSDPSI